MDEAFSGRSAKPVASRYESRQQSTAIELFSVFLNTGFVQLIIPAILLSNKLSSVIQAAEP